MRKAIILARVSTKEQEETGLSIKRTQLPKMQEYAIEKGIDVVEEYVFQETASQKLRKKFDEMIERVKKDKEIEIIISFRVDRLTRNYRDAVEMDLLRTEYHKELHFVDDRLVLTEKSFGRDIQDWDMKVFLAKQHINRCQEDAYNTQESKLKALELYGMAPYGYRNIKDDQGQSDVIIEPFEAGIVKFIFNEYSTGASSYLLISKKIQEQFGVKMYKSKVEKIIRQPFYMGLMKRKDGLYRHKYETIISEEVFAIVTDIREGRALTKKKGKMVGKSGLFRGLISCADCGCAISPSPNRHKKLNRNVQSDCYYYCTNSKGIHKKKPQGTNDAELISMFADLFKSITIPEKDLEYLQKSLNESHEGKVLYNEEQIDHFRREIDKRQKMIESAYEDKCAGSITQDYYNNVQTKWRNEQTDFQKRLDKVYTADKEYYITASYLLELASRSHELFLGSEPEQKRQIIQLTLQNLQFKDGKLVYEWQKPFDSIFESANSLLWGQLLDSFMNLSIEFKVNLENIRKVLQLPSELAHSI